MGCSPSRLPGESSQNLPLMPGCFMATYQIQPDYVFSEELHVYGEDKDKMARLPAPHPPTRTKDEIFDPNLFTKLDRRADKAPAKLLKEHYSSLMHYLLDGVKDPLGKVRVIYRWITAQNVDKILIPKNPPEVTTPLHQVWKIRNKKGNYAQLVSIMCRLAGVPCVIVHGKLKGSTYEVGSPVDEKTHYGEWNAVLIDEDWWLLNAYWGACALGSNGDDDWVEVETGEEVKADGERPATTNGRQSKAEKEFMYVCDENYFLAEPKQMVSTHLPTVEAWQLLNEPVSSDRFQTMAFLKDRFFNLRMSVISHPDCIITSHSGDVELLFGLPEEDSLFLKYYFLLFRLDNRKPGEAAPKYDRYVFLHKKRPDLLSVRVRTPVPGTFRLELVGKDTRTKTPQYDYDWVCLYKLHFEFAADKCLPFPETPMLGWGPGMPTLELGLAPLNHLSGLVPAGNNGETRLSFMVRDPDVVSQLQFSAMLVKGGVREQLCRDRVVHRLEHGQLIFNVSTPKPGEYRIALNAARKDNPDQVENFCNYLITSDQKERRAAYPRGFEGALGQKPACSRLGIIPLSHHSGMIYTETGEVQISFKLTQPVDVTLSIVGNDIMISDSKRLVHETMEDHVVTYVVRLPTNGNFGLRVIGKAKDGGLFESVYDYVIQYPKTRGNRRPEENSTGTLRALPPRREEAVVKAVSEEIPGVVPDSPKDELPPPTMAALSSPTPLNTPAMDGEAHDLPSSDNNREVKRKKRSSKKHKKRGDNLCVEYARGRVIIT